MKKLLLIAALIVALLFPTAGRAAELNNITSSGVDGNLVFYDASKNIIMTLDAANRKLSFPSGSLLETLGTTIKLRNITYTLPSADGAASTYLKTDGSGTLTWAAPTSTVAWDDIGAPDADKTLAFAGYKETISSTLNAAGAVLTFTNTTADLTADVSFIDLKYTDDGDANGYFLRAYDNAGGDLKFSIGADGAVVIAGTAEGTDALTITGGDITLTDGDLTLSSGDLSVTGNFTLTGSFYQSAIAAAAAGNVNLTVDAAGNGTITIGGTSTGATILPGAVQMTGNVDIGNAATDTLTITSIIDSNVTLDDGVTDSPSLIFKDATDETATLAKVDGANLDLTTSATEGLRIVTGNLRVGNGSPGTAAMDGEDFYVNGDSEFDGAVQIDGALTAAAGATVSGGTINLNASSNNAVNIGTGTTTSTVTIGGAGNQQIDVGNGAAVKAVNVGSSNTTSTTTLLSGSGGINLNASNNQPTNINSGTSTGTVTVGGTGVMQIDVGAGGTGAKTINIGDGASTGAITVKSGSGGLLLNESNNQPTNIGTGTTTGTVTIGGAGVQAIDIGNGAAAKTVALGSSNTTSTTTLLSGSGGVNVNVDNNQPVNVATGTSTGTITIGGAGAQSIAIGNGAAAKTVTLGSTNTTSTTTINSGSGGIVVAGNVSNDGTKTLGGFLKTVTDDTNGKTLNVNESGTIQTNAGAGGAAAWTLPDAAVGVNYCFVVMAAQELRVTPAAGDVINIAGIAAEAAEYWTANAAGESLCLVAVDTTNWIATSYTGTWTQQTPP